MDLSNLSLSEMYQLQKDLGVEIEKRKVSDKKNLIAELQNLAAAKGFSLQDVLGAAVSAKAAKITGVAQFRILLMSVRPGPAAAESRNGSEIGCRRANRLMDCASNADQHPKKTRIAGLFTGPGQFGWDSVCLSSICYTSHYSRGACWTMGS